MSTLDGLVGNRYQIKKLLSLGSTSSAVYLACDTLQGEDVVLKPVPAQERAALSLELYLLQRLRHPNLIQVLDIFIHDTQPYYVLTYAPGLDFQSWAALDRNPSRICAGAAAVLRAIHYLHANGLVYRHFHSDIVHVDVGQIGMLPALRLISIEHIIGAARNEFSRPLGYLAPEIIAGEPATPASDLYSFGVLLFAGLWGRLPNTQVNPLVQESLIPEEQQNTPLSEMVLSLLSPSPEERPSFSRIWEGLGLVTGHTLPFGLDELKGPYLPAPLKLVGCESNISRISAAIQKAKTGSALAFHLIGAGKSSLVKISEFLAKLAGFKTVVTDHPAALINANQLCHVSSEKLEAIITQWIEICLEDARQVPLLIGFDGCRSDDPITQIMVRQLFHAIDQQPEAGLLFFWTGDLPENSPVRIESIDLPYLTSEQMSEVVQTMFYGVEPPLWQDQLYDLTGGDPRLVVELVQMQIEAGFPDHLALPEDRGSLMEQRLSALSPAERQLLAIIAHTPRSLPLAILKTIAPDNMGAIARLLHKGYVTLDAKGYHPANPFVRRAAQGFLTGKALIQLHQHFCDVLQAESHPDGMALGHHLLWAGYVHQGAQILLQTPIPPLDDLERAASLLPPEDALLVDISRYLARYACARGDFNRALAIADMLQRSHSDAACYLQAEILVDAGRPLPALEILAQLKAPATSTRHLLAARAHFQNGNYSSVIQEVETSRTLANTEPNLELQLDHLAGLSLIYSGKIAEGLEQLQHAEDRAKELKNDEVLARIHNSCGIGLQQLGRVAEASQKYREALAIAERNGELSFAASYLLNLGMLAHHSLDLDQALRSYHRAEELAARCSAGATQAGALAVHGNLLLLLGAFSEAKHQLELAAAIALKAGATTQLGHIYLYQAEYWLNFDDLKQAETCLQLACNCFTPGHDLAHTATDLLFSELCLRKKEFNAGAQTLENLIRRLSRDNPHSWRAYLLWGKGLLHEQPPQLDRAIAALELSLALARQVQFPERIWESMAWLAQAYKQAGREEAAIFYASCFYQELDTLRQQIPLTYRQSFNQRPDIKQARQGVREICDAAPESRPSPKEIQRLLAINKVFGYESSWSLVLQQIIESALELTNAERGFVLLEEADAIKVITASPSSESLFGSPGAKVCELIARQSIHENHAIITANVSEENWLEFVDLNESLDVRAVLCVPFHFYGQTRGALYLDHHYQPNIFKPKHLYLIEALADQASLALKTRKLLEEEAKQRRELSQAKAQVEALNRELEGQVTRQSQALQNMSEQLRAQEEELVRRFEQLRIVGHSKVMRDLYVKIDRMAEADLPVLIYGESGTGKELVARAIHHRSPRKEGPFVPVNCAAIPANLLESELFGHKKGSFTGAVRDRPGLFEVAGRGTLFLDEIGDMPLEMQAKLLRVLQEGTFRRIGDEQERQAHCRVLSATNKSLEFMVARHQFREDLYYRLNVFCLPVPPLRERIEDIPLLIQHILSSLSQPITLSPAALRLLLHYDWPGNVRQLENELLRAAFLSEGTIAPGNFSISLTSAIEGEEHELASLTMQQAVQEAVHKVERQFIERALTEENYNISAAAKLLGIHRVVLHQKMRSLGISRKKNSTSSW